MTMGVYKCGIVINKPNGVTFSKKNIFGKGNKVVSNQQSYSNRHLSFINSVDAEAS